MLLAIQPVALIRVAVVIKECAMTLGETALEMHPHGRMRAWKPCACHAYMISSMHAHRWAILPPLPVVAYNIFSFLVYPQRAQPMPHVILPVTLVLVAVLVDNRSLP